MDASVELWVCRAGSSLFLLPRQPPEEAKSVFTDKDQREWVLWEAAALPLFTSVLLVLLFLSRAAEACLPLGCSQRAVLERACSGLLAREPPVWL